MSYKVIVYDSTGAQMARIREWEQLFYTQAASGPGRVEMEVPNDGKATYLANGNYVVVVRDGTDVFTGKIDWETKEWDVEGEGTERLTVRGPSIEHLPPRVIKRPAGQDEETHTDNADDAVKAFVRNCYETGYADADRELSGFSVEADDAEYPTSETLAGEYQELILDKLKEWHEAYDIDWWVDADVPNQTFVFRTKYPRRGTDRSSSVYFTVGRHNVERLTYTKDAHDKANLIYVGGPGEGQAQTVNEVYNGSEPTGWDRREMFVAAPNAEHDDELDMVGAAALSVFGEDVENVTFKYRETDGCVWGTDFVVGDKVTAYDPTYDVTVAAKIEEIQVEVLRAGDDVVEDVTIRVGRDQASAWDRFRNKVGPFSKFDDNEAPATPTVTGDGYDTAVSEDDQGNQTVTLELDWDDNSELDLADYQAEVKKDGETKWSTQRVSVSEAIFEGLELGSDYYARVKALDRAGNESSYLDFNSGSAISMPTDTTGPTDQSATIGYNSLHKAIEITWTNPSESDHDHVEIWRNSSGSWTGASKVGEAKGESWVDEVNTLDATFYYNLKFVDRAGNTTQGDAGNWLEANTDTTAPDAPTNLSVTTGTVTDADGHIIPWMKVTWDYPSPIADVVGFEIQVWYDTDDDASYADEDPDVWTVSVESGESSGALKRQGVPGNMDYRVRIRSKDDAGLVSSWTGYQTGTTSKDNSAPDQPTCSVDGIKGGIRITASYAGDWPDDWATCRFYANTSTGFSYSGDTNLVHEGRTKTFEYDTGSDYTSWYARVEVVDSSGNVSTISAEASGTPSKQSGSDIDNNAIDNDHVADQALDAIKILLGSTVDLSDWIYGTYHMNWNYIDNISIGTADIQDAAITDAKIDDLSADKITAGTITATVSLNAAQTITFTTSSLSLTGNIGDNGNLLNLNGNFRAEGDLEAEADIFGAGYATSQLKSVMIDGDTVRGDGTKVVNLDADQLDGYDASNSSGDIPVSNGTLCSNLNADLLDGQEGSYYRDADNINAGTLSTDRYSAHADLTAEGYLGDASGDLAQNNGTLQTNLNADEVDGYDASESATASTLAARDSDNYLHAYRFVGTQVVVSGGLYADAGGEAIGSAATRFGTVYCADVNKSGSSSAVEETSEGMVRMISIESSEVWYIDFQDVVGGDGKVEVRLDPLFDEVTTGPFFVVPMFETVKRGEKLVVGKRGKFMVMAKRRGYGNTRFEQAEEKNRERRLT